MKNSNAKLRVLIVDDEPPARDLIATVLASEPDVEVVGECSDGEKAVAAIGSLLPDLVFLDVRMPKLDGFGVLAELPAGQCPLVVFVTAFDQYAVQAFETHALDYLLKPFEYDRLREAVRRARAHLAARGDSAYAERLVKLLEGWSRPQDAWERVAVRESGRVLFMKPREIDWIEAEGNYVRLHAGRQSYLLRETLSATEEQLALKKFVRVNRSTLVNLEKVREWRPLFHGDGTLVLEDGTTLAVSRLYRENLDRFVPRLG